MKSSLLVCLALVLPVVRAAEPGYFPAPVPVVTESAPEPKSHPLKGVVIDVMTEKTALLVKHEEVPGVMRAMTMRFKVDPAVLEKVKSGDAIQALMSRRADGWWLTEVAVVAPAK